MRPPIPSRGCARPGGVLPPLRLSIAALLLAAASGCGAGGGGSGSAPAGSDVNGVASQVSAGEMGDGRVEVRFILSASGSRQIGTELEYSEDRGLTYSAATLSDGGSPATGLAATPEGVSHVLLWEPGADLADLSQQDLRMRVNPYDAASRARGVSAESPVFGIGSGSFPRVSAVSAPPGPIGGWVDLSYQVADPDGDHVAIEAEFSLDGGARYQPATVGLLDGAVAVSAPPGGASHRIAWHAQGDAPESSVATARIRLRAVDTAAGPFAATVPFRVDTRAPRIDLVTVEEIPGSMNGSVPFTNTHGQAEEFSLLLPEWDFAIGITFAPGPSQIDAAGLEVVSGQPLGGGSAAGGVDAGADIGGRFSMDVASGSARLILGQALAFASGVQTITARVHDVLGNVSPDARFDFVTGPATPGRRPFENGDRWRLDFGRDNFAISSSIDAQGTVRVTTAGGANGVPDFVEDLRILGLQSAAPPRPAVDAGLNGLVLSAVQHGVMGILNELYGRSFDGSPVPGSARVEFGLFPFSGPHSRLGVGGDDPVPGYTLGRAEFDYKNSLQNDAGEADLGVFTTNLIDFYINQSFAFRSRFNPLIPGRGTPLGFHSADVTVLSASFDRQDPGNTPLENQRYDQIELAVDAMARSVAAIAAHEIGHSVGLVANGGPPHGLFGGEHLASFSGTYTTPYHLDTVGNDLMAASLSFSAAILTGAAGPRFNEISIAYLRERILLE